MELDDPAADPQRVRALKLIRKLADEKAKKEQSRLPFPGR